MGMTIEKYLKETNTVLITQDAFVEMKDTMRKYQKIQEIVRFGNANELGFEYIGEKITEVIEYATN